MIKNRFNQDGTVRELIVGDSKAIIKKYCQECDQSHNQCYTKTIELSYVEYSEIESGNKKFLEITTTEGEKAIINVELCNITVKVQSKAHIQYYFVADEVFIKVAEGEKQTIYDVRANMIISDTEYNIEVVFGGCQPIIKLIDKRTGKSFKKTLEGYTC